jgi:hypothetical protein
MHVDVERDEIEAILHSIEHSVERIQNAGASAYEVRQRELTKFEIIQHKLRQALQRDSTTDR